MPKRRRPNIWAIILVGSIFALFVGAFLFQGSAYAGGWEVQGSIDKLIVEDKAFSYTGLHSVTKDVDGNFIDAVEAQGSYSGIYPDAYDKPDIYAHTSYPYYIRPVGTEWVLSDSPFLLDTYDRDISDNEFVRYNHYVFGYDLTIQTRADRYHKPFGSYLDYGYSFEKKAVDVSVRTEFAVTPWTPVGSYENWSVIGGWAGIMSSSVVAVSKGLVQEGASENYGHTITGLNSRGDALNMYGGGPVDFKNPSTIAGVPSKVSIENSAILGAGAQYTTDFLGHWDSLAVRNVYVQYKIRVDVVTVLEYELAAGHQDEQKPPEEDNTAYQPEVTPWRQFLESLGAIGNWFGTLGLPLITMIVIGVVVVVVVIFVVRPILNMRGRR